jgi:protein-S-isoprenylcysteine O-methyltransferase Ste14
MATVAWWKGARGEWYVAVQLILMALLFFGPKTVSGWLPLIFPFSHQLGIILGLVGLSFLCLALFKHGRKITPVPHPGDRESLIISGPYRIVRHPMYCGGILLGIGWAFVVEGWLTFGYALVLLIFADIKARREEKWLMEKFSTYAAYKQRVRKLVPFVY